VHHIIATGKDPSHLGRWVLARLQGKQGITLRIGSAYRPCELAGHSDSVWEQHIQHCECVERARRACATKLAASNDSASSTNNDVNEPLHPEPLLTLVNPPKLFLEDLSVKIAEWKRQGDQIII
jgi:hypothetical protein